MARTWTRLVLLGALTLVGHALPAHGGVQAEAYAETIRLVEGLYLYPERVDAAALLRAGARGLAEELHWLLVESDANTVYLRHGDGTAIGSLSVANLETLPEALASLEDLVGASGYGTDGVDLRLAILQGVTDGLDRYSTVLSGERLNRFDVRLKGTLVGVGLTVRLTDERLRITSVLEGGPAEAGGVQAGDVIVRIDGVSTVNMPVREASRRIRGEPGSTVELVLERGGRPITVQLERRRLVVPNVEHQVLEGNVGYVKITHFSQRTDENLRLALKALSEQGALANGLVIDLRHNTGGSMKDSARSADAFVHQGLLLRTVGPDGGTVRNLQSRMDARSSGDEPDVPVVILTDRRTASGSEIMAGGLVQLQRAALVGSRSFGKGTVQKVYPIDAEARLKLTVARYLLAGGMGISEAGLDPDLPIGDIVLDDRGMRFRGFTESETGAPFEEVVPVVLELDGWRGRGTPVGDVRLDAARRAVLEAKGPGRDALLAALARVSEEIRAEQEAHLVEALGAHGIDWTRLGEGHQDGVVQADVRVVATPSVEDPNAIDVRATVSNRESAPLERVAVVLHCETFPVWDGVALPIGRIGAGETATGLHTVRLAPGVAPREDDVTAVLRVAGRDPVEAAHVVLGARSEDPPVVAITGRLVDAGESSVAQVTVHNLSDVRLDGVEVAFEHPGDLDVELTTQAARIATLGPRASARVELGLRLGVSAPPILPLGLTVQSDNQRRPLARWPLDLPVDSAVVSLQAPRVTVPGRPLSTSVGPLTLDVRATDETRLDHLVVYANGDKVGWAPGGRGQAAVQTTFQVQPGENVLVVLAEDEHGVVTRESYRVRGELGATVDADAP